MSFALKRSNFILYKTEVLQYSATTMFQSAGELDALQISALNDRQHLAFADRVALVDANFNKRAAVFSD